MCGIFAYLNYDVKQSRQHIVDVLLNGLRRLEYRGYDSAGISVDQEPEFVPVVHNADLGPPTKRRVLVFRQQGKIDSLAQRVQQEAADTGLDMEAEFLSHAGIAHTRWATHGVPAPRNSHPQTSGPGNDFVVVHNGIITNYKALRETLERQGFQFESETDTEVIPKLAKFVFDKYQSGAQAGAQGPEPAAQNTGQVKGAGTAAQPQGAPPAGPRVPFTQIVMDVMRQLEGAYALLFKSPHYPNEIVACKRGSPLLMGVKDTAVKGARFSNLGQGGGKEEVLVLDGQMNGFAGSDGQMNGFAGPDGQMNGFAGRDCHAPCPAANGHHLPVCGPISEGWREGEEGAEREGRQQGRVARRKREFFLASDASAVVEHTKTVMVIEDNEVVHIRDGVYALYSFNPAASPSSRGAVPQELQRALSTLRMEVEQIMKGSYEHFMAKEIHEQPESLTTTMRGRLLHSGASLGGVPQGGEPPGVLLGGLKDHLATIRRSRRIIFIGCGSSFHAALAARPIVEELSGVPVQLELASDLLDRQAPIYREDTAVFVSQSGETADTLQALEYAKARGALCVGITNTVGSAIARGTHCGVHINAGCEIGVASTKAYTSQIAVIVMLALALGGDTISTKERRERIIHGLLHLPDVVREVLGMDEAMKQLARQLQGEQSLLVFGRGYNYATALEAALKVKEVALMHSEGILAGEMKHGPLALVDESLPLIVVATRDCNFRKQQSVIEQLQARKGRLIVLCSQGDASTMCPSGAAQVIEVPQVEDCLQPIVNAVPLQLLAYHLTVLRGFNVDQPRNLAKSVTVE